MMKINGETKTRYLIVDDDDISTLLYGRILKQALGDKIDLHTINLPGEAVNQIRHLYGSAEVETNIVLFLDINMPVLTGWDVLNLIEKMEDPVTKCMTIYMLSSSIDPNDKKRALDHPLVTAFFEKPLTVEKIKSVFMNG